METVHKSVLLEEAVEGLNLKNGSVVVDATLGGGGHSIEILKKILPGGKLIAIDRDAQAIEKFKSKIRALDIKIKPQDLILIQSNFSELDQILRDNMIEKVDAILADFGLSSDQLDDKARGFSFNSESALDMRMDQRQKMTAKDIINRYSQESLVKIIRNLGEEKFANRVAQKIVEAREIKEIESTAELLEIISQAIPEKYKHKKIHWATKTFQAIRMEVNQELESIKEFIQVAIEKLNSEGRLAVISFHSGEDRIVKNIFKEAQVNCVCPVEFPVCRCTTRAKIKNITKKPRVASEIELKENPRARSAKLRIVEKI
ncbi:MAG: Ribosomal RNA small subunit methyltransferase H [Candidatus Moranbacteria bacterium GW2011_GWE1_35_17]|nr:MAG: Ribosomal RNA small subunit methyltransferase H [Candidatus Moranbacteria bacterium GW2011_GWE2_35_164]KKP69059.1 MAG: Ribosomal RNA small subunit methyltransferase H [Candidatus Moranbacteria bacterium GW2011_GWE1_35_17]KKP84504.1 MAG: Ribosomal RNA small subunit methyltransferase H [Candidatus Moranbacteria bacterium GW2011_GWF1_35_5]KKP84810.1 MAG: Ribosomal RNA small subunit methyltransferase H [Candidatus Moranbacteria bacterium GW2011_GWF2_35_54]